MAVNEYGAELDRNGYVPSIVQEDADECCAICYANGSKDPLNRHEIFGGAYRRKSKRLGLWVSLCHDRCHQNGPNSVHQSAEANRALKVRGAEGGHGKIRVEQRGFHPGVWKKLFGGLTCLM